MLSILADVRESARAVERRLREPEVARQRTSERDVESLLDDDRWVGGLGAVIHDVLVEWREDHLVALVDVLADEL